jgi:manganese/zinc/iron transport system permease protein
LLTYLQRHQGAAQAGLDAFLFGQAAALVPRDLRVLGLIGAVALLAVALTWKELKVTTFDADFARSLGRPVVAIEFGLTVMIAIAVVIGLQLVGVILMVALVIAPAAAARQWARRLEGMVLLAALFGAVSGVTGALVSASVRGLATGPLIVLVASALVAVSLLLAPGRGVAWQLAQAASQRRSLRAHRLLVDLYRLGLAHDDPRYRSEQGMLDAYFGGRTAHVLRRLQRRGLVERVEHMPEEGAHWLLTDAGLQQARALLEPFGTRPVDASAGAASAADAPAAEAGTSGADEPLGGGR